EGLTALGLNYIPSVGNFILVDVKQPGKDVYQTLLRQGVIVRPLDPYGLINYIRITIGTEQENTQCLKVLKQAILREVTV
ncbi:MAG TPA: aminotransferase class I/II-fold pyridoxal phosphate-dependent enzyme, partial [Candidatus Berkiella sp.]|nr:aminotransferase class I/II-fold pyridoxal phosphate-dependent enzyme [Candidatus Berkiella sp.]